VVTFVPGRQILHRQFTGDTLTFLRSGRVLGHDERGLRVWLPHGAPMALTRTADGRGLRDMPFREWVSQERTLVEHAWWGPNIMMLVPPGAAHSVWWFWDARGRHAAWYINLEEPGVAWDDGDAAGLDTTDQDLDVWVYPDHRWEWKDEDELAERLEHPDHYWVTDEAAVWAEGRRVIAQAEAGEFPFDGTWVDFRPDPDWTAPAHLPPGWDRPRAR
jgi:predicted RNA-binding protein associated with RNAse of E/G family